MIIKPITASRFRSDGGAMFGLVPKTIWSRRIEADERNTIQQNATALLIELADGRRCLIETGCGDPSDFTPRDLQMHGITDTRWLLMDALENRGWKPESVDAVILSHMHWDHIGGVYHGKPAAPTFPNAVHYIHVKEWEDAHSGNPLFHKAYPEEVIAPFRDKPLPKLDLISGDQSEILPGITMIRVGGHTRGQCVIRMENAELRIRTNDNKVIDFEAPYALYAADACPTRHHFRLVFQPAYDFYPLDSRRWKQKTLPQIASDGALLFFDHDPDFYGVTIQQLGPDRFEVDRKIPVRS